MCPTGFCVNIWQTRLESLKQALCISSLLEDNTGQSAFQHQSRKFSIPNLGKKTKAQRKGSAKSITLREVPAVVKGREARAQAREVAGENVQRSREVQCWSCCERPLLGFPGLAGKRELCRCREGTWGARVEVGLLLKDQAGFYNPTARKCCNPSPHRPPLSSLTPPKGRGATSLT